MKRLRLSYAHLSFVHAASAAALFQLFGCTTSNGESSTGATSSTSSTSTATATASSSANAGSGGGDGGADAASTASGGGSGGGDGGADAASTASGGGSGGGDGGAGGAAPSSGIFVERFEITNASTGKGGATAPDYSTKIIAAAIQADGAASPGCIDLRSVGFSGAGSTIVAESVIALLSAPLSEASHQAIETGICSLTPSGCEVTSTVTPQTLAESAIEQPVWGPDGFQIDTLYFPLDGYGAVPRMSDACVSGLYVDSWNDAANTPEAKAYLTAIGVDLASPGLQLGLDRKVGEDYVHVFSFGMISP